MTSKIKVDNINKVSDDSNIINKCGTTITLGASGDSINLAAGASQSGFGRTGTVDWQTGDIKTATFIPANGKGYFCNTVGGEFTVNLPAGSAGDIVSVQDYNNTFDTYKLTINPNGTEVINGGAAGGVLELDTEGQGLTLVYVDSTVGWRAIEEQSYAAQGSNAQYICASVSGVCNAISTCGDFKVAVFKNPGTFTVTCAGNACGSNTRDYLVVAGGGSGGASRAGGGGAGGFRVSNGYGSPSPTMSPLASPTALPVAAAPYPVTVGGGGAGVPSSPNQPGTSGTNSVFTGTTTITSTAGGGGGNDGNSGLDGGSGGGGGESSVGSAIGSGNTPPVSPPQGFPGGASDHAPPTGGPHPVSPAPYAGGGGGGAGEQGQQGAPGGPGGDGSYVPTSLFSAGNGTPGPVPGASYFAGGGAGIGCATGSPGAAVPGGAGGGGASPAPGNPGTAGTQYTGGGGGAWGDTGAGGTSGNGGDGIVLIRYKFQN